MPPSQLVNRETHHRTVEIRVRRDEHGVHLRRCHRRKGVLQPGLITGGDAYRVETKQAKRAAQRGWVVPVGGTERIGQNADPGGGGMRLFQQLEHFGMLLVRDQRQTGYVACGRRKITSCKLDHHLLACRADQSTACANTMGTVRVAICNAATVGLAVARMTSGASVTNSAA